MPKVSGFTVPKMNPRSHDGNIRWLEPVERFANYHDYDRGEHEESQDEEEPEEPLDIVPKVATIIFLVSLLRPSLLIDKHVIDLTKVLLHLGNHPLVFLVKQFLKSLLVSVTDVYCNIQFGWGILQDVINMSVDPKSVIRISLCRTAKRNPLIFPI